MLYRLRTRHWVPVMLITMRTVFSKDQLLGEDLANESLMKADDHLIDDLLNNENKSQTTVISPKKVLTTKAAIGDISKPTLSSILPASQSTTNTALNPSPNSKPTLLKTANPINCLQLNPKNWELRSLETVNWVKGRRGLESSHTQLIPHNPRQTHFGIEFEIYLILNSFYIYFNWI